MIQLKNITKSFDLNKNKVEVLKGINLQIADDEFIALMGPSGSGKSTLLGILAGIDSPTSGEIYIYGQDISKKKEDELARFRNENVGIVFQAYNLIPSLNAIQNVKAPLYAGKNKLTSKEIDERAKKLLDMVGLSHRETHKPGELSGGEQQRVAIARALINNPKILVADEPTGNLDAKTGEEILDLILKINKDMHLTIIMATHNEEIAKLADRVVNISDGIITNE
ncbi:MAG TPA: ABC transporter ATP-binding protein [Candidatus Dojkabacteria bacterium]|jgi:putative ABC transport system ATP-binding protein|nr:ABC transporter ATP-binding protein [Candidatus Dojkabacteria bacterium]MBP8979597.1 ABC transporter ATP-binding protein [Candidatus Dojkabacteria bacterium]HOV34843.1 ABC transporter ATP-binding protein [Candidatus Dojkabacteria bacterium]HPQ79761.1 ABC transporter ATP-binding protein [Candidatus Dojkabacteria bacterium]